MNTKLVITPILNVLFNKILYSGSFPDAWSESIIVPLYKSGSRSDPSNYRGISLVDVMYKIFAGILNDRLTRFANELYLIDEAQAGFRTGYSVTDNMFILQSLVQKYASM